MPGRREDDELHLEVEDDGPGLSPQQQLDFKPGVGVSNTRARLQQLYGTDHVFTMVNGINFNKINAALDPRTFQIGVRFDF